MHPRVLVAVALAAAPLLGGCSDSDSLPFESRGVAGAVASLRLSQGTVTAAVGDSVRLNVDARSRSGALVHDADVRWRVQDPSIATVENGLVVPLRAGNTIVLAIANGRSVSAKIKSWGDASPDGVDVDPDPVTVGVGQSVMASGDLQYTNGKHMKLRTSYEWTSLDPSVATVSAGKITGVAAGETKVVATLEALADTVAVTVTQAATPTLSLSPATISVESGKTIALTPSVSDGSDVAALGPLAWSSADPAVAAVTSAGVVAGVAAGTTTVEVAVGGLSASATVTVTAPASLAPPAPSTPVPAGTHALPPAVRVDVAMPAVTGRSIRVNAGESLQAAIDAAQPGDEIVLQAGATFVSPTILKRKSGTGWITIRTSGTLPPQGTRVTPAHAAQMPKLVPFHPSETALRTEPGAHHYRLVGLEITGVPGESWSYTLVALGDGDSRYQTSLDQVPHHLVLDRVYVHGSETMDLHRCIGLNSGHTAIVDSYISDCHGRGKDTQAIAGWNGPGPYRIANNYLAGAGENVMFGGADPGIVGLTPSDIEIVNNHIHKPLSWRGVWMVKNLFELKHAQRVLFEGNVLENNWVDGQSGFAVQLTPLSDNNSAPWTKVKDITFRGNVIRNSAAGINVSGRNAYGATPVWPEEPATRIHIVDNLLYDIGLEGQNGRLFQLLNDIRDLRIERNTGFASHSAFMFDSDRGPQSGLVIVDNILGHGYYGFFSSHGQGSAALAYYAPGAIVTGNVLVGSPSHLYPAGNYFPSSISEVGFVNPAGGNYQLSTSSTYLTSGWSGAN